MVLDQTPPGTCQCNGFGEPPDAPEETEAQARARAEKVMAKVRDSLDADLLIFSGPIDYGPFRNLQEYTEKCRERPNLGLFLSTLGGDPHAAFRIARCLKERYKKITIYIVGFCKSAGTLVALAGDELVIADSGELGPLDVQLRKPDEIHEFGSGLDTTKALEYLSENAIGAFRKYLVDIYMGARISTRLAANIATEMTVGLFSKIYEQIDPIRLGEIVRATNIATEYGRRFPGNLQQGALQRLVHGYPAHGFVIDRVEAQKLFKNCRAPSPDEDALLTLLSEMGVADDLRDPPESTPIIGIIKVDTGGHDEQADATSTDSNRRGTPPNSEGPTSTSTSENLPDPPPKTNGAGGRENPEAS